MQIAATRPLLQALRPQFRTPSLDAGELVDLPPAAGVPYREACIRPFRGVKNDYLDKNALTTVDGQFGVLAREQFDKLHAEFGGCSPVGYDPQRAYHLGHDERSGERLQ